MNVDDGLLSYADNEDVIFSPHGTNKGTCDGVAVGEKGRRNDVVVLANSKDEPRGELTNQFVDLENKKKFIMKNGRFGDVDLPPPQEHINRFYEGYGVCFELEEKSVLVVP